MTSVEPGAPPKVASRDVVENAVSWIANYARVYALITVVALAAGGILFSRPELVLIAAPLLVAVVLRRKPSAGSRVKIGIGIGSRSMADNVAYELDADVPEDADAVVLRLHGRSHDRWDVVVDAASAADLRGEVRVVHSGPQEIVRVDYSLISGDGAFLTAPKPGPRSARVIAPRSVALRQLPLPMRMVGLSGGHDSARPGDGGEFRDVSQFAPGDRQRRIDWKVTARRGLASGDLYVRRTFATADATVLLMMDSRDDVAELFSGASSLTTRIDEPTSLDMARDAAASIASAYIKAGDRVGFQDLAAGNRLVAPGGGIRQLQRLVPAIARSAPVGAPSRRLRFPIIPAGSIVYVISTFLDDDAARMAELWRLSGHRIVAIDTLIPETPAKLTQEQASAVRIVSMEREDRLASMRALGIDVVHWRAASGESAEVQLSIQSRIARRPR